MGQTAFLLSNQQHQGTEGNISLSSLELLFEKRLCNKAESKRERQTLAAADDAGCNGGRLSLSEVSKLRAWLVEDFRSSEPRLVFSSL